MDSIELFGGGGGLGLGLARAGFHSVAFLEWDDDAVETVRYNRLRGVEHIKDWCVLHEDVRNAVWLPYRGTLTLVSGGPPCQPFGIGGKKAGHADPRDMWPEAIRAVREALPSAFLFENVRNLAGPKFKTYLDWIETSLCHVTHERRPGESHIEHVERVKNIDDPADYRTSVAVVNAADFGAPQQRTRVLVAGIRSDLDSEPGFPMPTHSRDRLLWDQWVTGDYWRRHGLKQPSDDEMDRIHRGAVKRLRAQLLPPTGLPWITLRDATADLGQPDGKNHHILQEGATIYPGHTGSPLDWPAKALKAGDHGVPGGENMIRFSDGTVRYLTLREAARLVGLPDSYAFPRSWTESMRALGNAVPAQLAEAAGRWLLERLDHQRPEGQEQPMLLAPRKRRAA
ncbi:MAG TPA: DNA (cytosine-5-)-methyltransferase [Acetobacteraceae bacterium]|jgi:DNA (cytosine-5)-methyltransferase 1|nr:DNA (cytosine-5-)-methyltransferase [Acetobacteraceae bacterium]